MAAVAVVTGCCDCPLCAVVVVSWGYQETQAICRHPDALARNVRRPNYDPPEKPPRWCPLRIAALPVQLSQGKAK